MDDRRRSNFTFAAVLAIIPVALILLQFLSHSQEASGLRIAGAILVAWAMATVAIGLVPDAIPKHFPPDATYRLHIKCPDCGDENPVFKRSCTASTCATVRNRWSYHPVDAVITLGIVVFFVSYYTVI